MSLPTLAIRAILRIVLRNRVDATGNENLQNFVEENDGPIIDAAVEIIQSAGRKTLEFIDSLLTTEKDYSREMRALDHICTSFYNYECIAYFLQKSNNHPLSKKSEEIDDAVRKAEFSDDFKHHALYVIAKVQQLDLFNDLKFNITAFRWMTVLHPTEKEVINLLPPTSLSKNSRAETPTTLSRLLPNFFGQAINAKSYCYSIEEIVQAVERKPPSTPSSTFLQARL